MSGFGKTRHKAGEHASYTKVIFIIPITLQRIGARLLLCSLENALRFDTKKSKFLFAAL